jgi:anti-sigma factor ChrR (cupin superfamily)
LPTRGATPLVRASRSKIHAMLVNAEFHKPAIVTPDDYRWVPSPQAGVERVMLDRVGAERGRATSLVRYAPESDFPRHGHPGGEEILVLSGIFSDDNGDYPAGWYLRNPPGSSHQPSSLPGAVILVKLWQMEDEDRATVRIDTRDPANWRDVNGRDVCPLFETVHERVRIIRLSPGETLFRCTVDSAELFVVDGSLRLDDRRFDAGSWIRLPRAELFAARASGEGATVYLKTGHLGGLIDGTERC